MSGDTEFEDYDEKTILAAEDTYFKSLVSPCDYYQVGEPIADAYISLGFPKSKLFISSILISLN